MILTDAEADEIRKKTALNEIASQWFERNRIANEYGEGVFSTIDAFKAGFEAGIGKRISVIEDDRNLTDLNGLLRQHSDGQRDTHG